MFDINVLFDILGKVYVFFFKIFEILIVSGSIMISILLDLQSNSIKKNG
jgi:hypothetical protein